MEMQGHHLITAPEAGLQCLPVDRETHLYQWHPIMNLSTFRSMLFLAGVSFQSVGQLPHYGYPVRTTGALSTPEKRICYF